MLYPGVPPSGVIVTAPSVPPKHVVAVVLVFAIKASSSIICIFSNCTHPY